MFQGSSKHTRCRSRKYSLGIRPQPRLFALGVVARPNTGGTFYVNTSGISCELDGRYTQGPQGVTRILYVTFTNLLSRMLTLTLAHTHADTYPTRDLNRGCWWEVTQERQNQVAMRRANWNSYSQKCRASILRSCTNSLLYPVHRITPALSATPMYRCHNPL